MTETKAKPVKPTSKRPPIAHLVVCVNGVPEQSPPVALCGKVLHGYGPEKRGTSSAVTCVVCADLRTL